MREHFVPHTKLPKSDKKKCEYFVPENIVKKMW